MNKRDVFGALVAIGLVVAACSSDGTESTSEDEITVQDEAPTPDEATVQDEVFSFEDDDLCEWVSEDTIAEFVSGEFEWEGTAVEREPRSQDAARERRGDVACHWVLTDSSGGHVTIFAPTALEVSEGVADYDDVGGVIVDQPVLGHPALSEGVAYIQEPFSNPVFGVPASNEYFIMDSELPEEVPMFGYDVYWESWYVVADEIIGKLGWTQTPG